MQWQGGSCFSYISIFSPSRLTYVYAVQLFVVLVMVWISSHYSCVVFPAGVDISGAKVQTVRLVPHSAAVLLLLCVWSYGEVPSERGRKEVSGVRPFQEREEGSAWGCDSSGRKSKKVSQGVAFYTRGPYT